MCKGQVGGPCLGHWSNSKAARVISLVGGVPSQPWSPQGSDALPTLVLQMMAAVARS